MIIYKFKKGDRVKYTNKNRRVGCEGQIGTIFQMWGLNAEPSYLIKRESGKTTGWMEKYIEKI